MPNYLSPPLPFYGKKDYVAPLIWKLLGSPVLYIEPFGGSLAVLLARPDYDPHKHWEVVGDLNGLIVNLYRAIKADAVAVAKLVDRMWAEQDLDAALRVINQRKPTLSDWLAENLNNYDVELAAYHLVLECYCLGSMRTNKVSRLGRRGVCAKSFVKVGVDEQGFVVNETVYEWLRAIQNRLHFVDIYCRDWKKTIEISVGSHTKYLRMQDANSTPRVGVFLDPPYVADESHLIKYIDTLTKQDLLKLRNEVLQWCIEMTNCPDMRIVLTGYEEYDELRKHGWRVYNFRKSHQSLRNRRKDPILRDEIYTNVWRERVYASPTCQPILPMLK